MKNYSLVVKNVKSENEFESLCNRLKEMDLLKYVFDNGKYFKKEKEAAFCTWEQQEWHHCNGQMIFLSEVFPKMIFQLTCREEDKDWRTYYKDGESELCIGETTFEQPSRIKWDCSILF